jgi:hypothetical protein
MAAIKPVRQWIAPHPGDDWTSVAARVFPNESADKMITALQGWNPHIAYRPIGGAMLCSDVIFIEASTGL